MKKRILTLMLIMVLIISVFSGCGRQQSTAADDDPSSQEDVAAVTDPASDLIEAPSSSREDVVDAAAVDSKDLIHTDPDDPDNLRAENDQKTEPVILGDEQFDEYLPLLEERKVALFSNHSGIVGDKIYDVNGNEIQYPEDNLLVPFGQDADGNEVVYGTHILDALIEQGVNVTAIFSPEHGFRGTEDAGTVVGDSVDEKTGVPILSLYASTNTHYPSADSMEKFDVLIVDMQDVGLRYYTYYISMYYLMDACAQYEKEVIILDRPNPNGYYVDGPILQEEYHSGVGRLPIPVVHGMTWGELAQMINGEGWLSTGADSCSLTVIPCKNYTHQTRYMLIRRPSPNLKDMQAVYLYASTCFFENTAVSVGRGTDYPFEIYGSPYLQGIAGNEYSFMPESMEGAAAPTFEGVTCYGRNLRDIPAAQILTGQIDLQYLFDAYQDMQEYDPAISFFGTQDGSGHYFIDYLFGTDEVRIRMEEGDSAEEIRASWQEEVDAFKVQRRPYLLYEE